MIKVQKTATVRLSNHEFLLQAMYTHTQTHHQRLSRLLLVEHATPRNRRGVKRE